MCNKARLNVQVLWSILLFCHHYCSFCSATQITANMLHHEEYLRDEFSKNGRRRGVGLVATGRAMADQVMISVCNQRNKEFSSHLPGLQKEGWNAQNLEFAVPGDQILPAQPITNVLEAVSRRDHQDKTARCFQKTTQSSASPARKCLKFASGHRVEGFPVLSLPGRPRSPCRAREKAPAR
jgi:hypothetical protein